MVNVDWQTILDELMAIRTRLDQIAAIVMGRQTREDLEIAQIWSCVHRHATRGEAIDCLNTSRQPMEPTAEARTLEL